MPRRAYYNRLSTHSNGKLQYFSLLFTIFNVGTATRPKNVVMQKISYSVSLKKLLFPLPFYKAIGLN
jgi:hypothetical protein